MTGLSIIKLFKPEGVFTPAEIKQKYHQEVLP